MNLINLMINIINKLINYKILSEIFVYIKLKVYKNQN